MPEEKKPVFHIGSIPIFGNLVLAPMDGITDSPFRRLIQDMGSNLCYSEFINALDVIHNSILYQRKVAFSDEERPIVFQIYDNDAYRIQKAAEILMKYHPDIIDINIGCSVQRVAGRGAGAGLLLEPQKIQTIFKLLKSTIDIPITAKIRLGWDHDSLNYLDIAKIIEDSGGSMIAVHARTRQDGFTGKVNWRAIKEIKQAVNVPVVGNGDVTKVSDIDKLIKKTGCDAVMIGRAAMDNPWLFQLIDRDNVSNSELSDLIHKHLHLMLEQYEENIALKLFRKYLNHYLKPFDLDRPAKIDLYKSASATILMEKLQGFLF